MLKLDNLEISGFKSFVDPVTIGFAGGITAIVGPNGCGKSNLSEAMTWVLGEQSARSLRGGTMEDVIFNGAESRRPLGMAECTLALRTDPSFPRSDEGRITIGRRVFRGGESQYRLNGKVVRLKEIRDLLMDTGLGLRAYSVIEQGKIGMILSGKPQERRRLIEEAAGITRYKSRKNIAELKLQEAAANLLRLDDIIAEVERALRSLKRQASAARRYQEKEREYRDLLARVLRARYALQEAHLAELRSHIDEATARDAALAADLHRDEAALAAGRETLEEVARALAAGHQRVADLAATIQGRQEFLKANRQTVVEIGERAAQDRALAERREQEIGAHAEALAALSARRAELAAERELAAAAVDRDEQQIAEAERDQGEAAARLEALRAALLADATDLAGLRQRVQQAEIELERGNFRRHHLDGELARRAHELRQAEEALALAQDKTAALEATLAERGATQQRVAGVLEATLRREAEAEKSRRGLEDELAGARQRQRLLAELAQAHAERRGGLLAALAEAGLEDPRFLAEEAHAALGWERTLDVYLGSLTDAVLLPPGADALGLAQELRERARAAVLIGRACPNPRLIGRAGPDPRLIGRAGPDPRLVGRAGPDPRLEIGRPGADPGASSERAGAGPQPDMEREGADPGFEAGHPGLDPGLLDDPAVVLTLGEALGLAAELAAALPPALLVRSPADAKRLASLHPGIAFLSRDGVWVQAATFHVDGPLDGEIAAPGALERESELAALAHSLPELEDALRAAAADLDRLVAQRAGHAAELNRLQGEAEQLRQELAVGRARLEDAAARHRRLASERETLSAEQGETAGELLRVEGRRAELLGEHAAGEEHHAQLEAALDEAQDELDRAKSVREGLRTESAGRRGHLEVLAERLAAQDRDYERLAVEVERGRRQVAAWREEAERLAGRRGELESALYRAERELQQALEERGAAEDELLAEQEGLDRHRQEVRTLEEHIGVHRARREAVRTEIEELRVTHAASKQDVDHLCLTYDEQFGEPLLPAEPAAESGVPESPFSPPGAAESAAAAPQLSRPAAPPLSPEELAELEAELARCKAALERLGPVNVLAVHEHDEQEERLNFLTTQRADVAQSVDSLRRTIREINETSSARFKATFDEVNKSFNAIFARLFRGGEAEMHLLDDEDVLESGIEIVARPPGKRLQNLMLLSGGEKALTAIALLFALFQTKPSPFCILDEVDAPLDDVNTTRFIDLLREMAGETQFIVITHNKLTMEVASRLYGVTMEEKGVSRLVSVEIDEIQPEARRATA
ncbi:MAG TPA: AAA family ATPase [Thermoanaerobaculia bacterium]|nr:AAA family ATPase [Thermoanaerobaculia bacterium]